MSNSPSSSDLADDNSRRTANINTDDIHFSTSHVFGNKQTSSPTENAQIPQERITGTLFFAVFTAVIGTAFQFGYASGVINAPQEIIKQFINQTIHKRNSQTTTSDSQLTLIFSFIVSIFCLGGMIGGLFGGFITDRLGRKGGMYVNNIISMVACLFMFLSKVTSTYELLFVGRFFIGLSCGYGSSVAPTYISEVSPKSLRGTLGAAFQLGVVISVLMSQIMSLSTVVGSATTWHIALSLPIIFSVIQIILLFFVPESPKYLLVKRNDEAGAEKGLRWLRKHSEVHHEITEMQDEKNQQQQAVSIGDLFRTPLVRWALLITVVLQLSQQLSGINAVFYYSTTIFKSADYSEATSENINIGLGATNIVVTILSSFLMDRLGRRILHMTGLGGMLVTVVILIISLLVKSTPPLISVITIVFFVAFFGIGPGSIPWLITAELFNQAYRVPASSIAVLVNWSANFLVAIGFNPLFTQVLGVPTFFIFVGLLLAFLLFTFFFVPETKAKNVETIYAEINAGQVWRKRRGQLLHGDNRSGQINDYGSTVDYGVLPPE